MLNYTEFKNEFITDCRELLAAMAAHSEYNDIEIEERSVTKAQRGVLTGLIFKRPDTVCAPTFYAEDFYNMYTDGHPLEELSARIIQDAMHYLHTPPVFPEIDIGSVLKGSDLRVRLINASENSDYLCDVPHINNAGLALIAEFRSGEYRAVITKGLLELLEMTEDELFEKALSNSAEGERATLYDLSEMFMNRSGDCRNLLDAPEGFRLPKSASLYALSNEKCYFGAASLFYPGMLKKLSYMMGGRFYVLPSSVHEVILLNASEADPQKLADLIDDVNGSVLEGDEFLSNELYMCESGRFRQVSYGGIVHAPAVLPC